MLLTPFSSTGRRHMQKRQKDTEKEEDTERKEVEKSVKDTGEQSSSTRLTVSP